MSSGSNSISQFLHRLGQRKKVVRHEATLHEFEELKLPDLILTKDVTIALRCSQCDAIIIFGEEAKTCKHCRLIGHEKCLNSLRFKCAKSPNAPRLAHHFKPTFFNSPTHCKHCGSLIWNVWPLGLSCKEEIGGCGMKIHRKCRDLICKPCRFIQETKSSANVSIEDFDIIEQIGSGSFSRVYLVSMKRNRKRFALKIVDKSTISTDPESALTEMRVLHFGRYHPFLPLLHCCFQTETRLCFVMEYIDGESLLVHLEQAKKLSEVCTRFYSAEIALAVNFLHNKGLLVRDLKLENVIIGLDGHCKLTDFGMSKCLDQSVDMKTKTLCGTPYYFCPEMINGLGYSFPCDWWALGVLMYELLAGETPFNAMDVSDDEVDQLYEMILHEEFIVPNYLTVEAQSVLEGLLTKAPERRLGWAGLQQHPFFLFRRRDGTREHLWDAIEQKQIKPPTMLQIDKICKYEPPEKLINDRQTTPDPLDPFSDFTYCSRSFKSLQSPNSNER